VANTKQSKQHGDYWMSLSDMMSSLMMIFLFAAIAFMLQVQQQQQQLTEIIIEYKQVKSEIYQALYEEFRDDLKYWEASIEPDTLSIKFQEPDVLFATGSYTISRRFQEILDDFFPRYLKILLQPRYKVAIQEIRIEGHTSSFWRQGTLPLEAYFRNMELSQARTRNVLEYVMLLPQSEVDLNWVTSKLTANGLSSSQKIIENGAENYQKSQRVEFRIRTNAEEKMGILGEKS
jgi:outer membrane protein OmpA-like peptidoglycan-associated protein